MIDGPAFEHDMSPPNRANRVFHISGNISVALGGNPTSDELRDFGMDSLLNHRYFKA